MDPRFSCKLQVYLLPECFMRALIAFSLLAFALAAEPQLQRWTDESGSVHYTDTPPPANAKNAQMKASARAGGAETPRRPAGDPMRRNRRQRISRWLILRPSKAANRANRGWISW